jgi:hypothetical protein
MVQVVVESPFEMLKDLAENQRDQKEDEADCGDAEKDAKRGELRKPPGHVVASIRPSLLQMGSA